ncbi:hypothetical protein ACQ4PT_060462 [Festuca glaucescens]
MDAALVPLLVSLLAVAAHAPAASAAPRAFFVFGDSLVDNGNNNYLLTTARADAPPYGIDYPSHRATGRFSNGLNIPDIISEHLGAEPALPYLCPELRGMKLLVGANFASAGVGILNDTGVQFVNIIRIGDQLRYFGEYQRKLRAFAGEEQAARLVGGALVLITLGGNDFVNNYYLVPMSMRSRQYALPDYVRFIVSEYRKILAGPYNGIGLCTPGVQRVRRPEAYAFWDAFHPTERANRIIVGQFMHGSTDYMHPMNLTTILAMDREGP